MKLQDFVQKNAGKELICAMGGNEYLYDNIIINARHNGNDLICVSVNLPWAHFKECFDIKKLDTDNGELVGFYYWLEDHFIPLVSERLSSQKYEKEN